MQTSNNRQYQMQIRSYQRNHQSIVEGAIVDLSSWLDCSGSIRSGTLTQSILEKAGEIWGANSCMADTLNRSASNLIHLNLARGRWGWCESGSRDGLARKWKGSTPKHHLCELFQLYVVPERDPSSCEPSLSMQWLFMKMRLDF